MMADIEVLTEDTAEVAAGKKYSPRPAEANKLSLLTEMRTNRADHRHIINAAKPYLPLAAVDLAHTWTERARIHTLPQLLNGFTKRTNIGWQKCHNQVLFPSIAISALLQLN